MTENQSPEFSFRSREQSLERFQKEVFDLLIIGGGITGAATARDAVSRGLKVALVEKSDFASGTSSRSSKLIHGGLRYLEHMEFQLVFEALSERAFLLKTLPHLVRPLQFYLPVYRGDLHGRGILGLGLWLYDLLALFRTPKFHKTLSKKQMLKEFPNLKSEGLKGGFQYFDASMWDDVLAVETLRAAHTDGAAVANYVEAMSPLWDNGKVVGFQVRDSLGQGFPFPLRATRVISCVGPWTDLFGKKISSEWKPWLNPSKGVHLVFDLKRFNLPGAVVMTHPEDGRISFAIPRPDFGAGVVIVGTTDAPTSPQPENADIEDSDVNYLLDLLNRFFPNLELNKKDIISAYVGVRPLVGGGTSAQALQAVSREHTIGEGPGGVVFVAGGKYTTHRTMAQEIVDFALTVWERDAEAGQCKELPENLQPSNTAKPFFNFADGADDAASAATSGVTQIPALQDPPGFPHLATQLRHAIRHGMVLRLEDFYLRRVPLYLSRADHGIPWTEELSQVWAEELSKSAEEARLECTALKSELARRSRWVGRAG